MYSHNYSLGYASDVTFGECGQLQNK